MRVANITSVLWLSLSQSWICLNKAVNIINIFYMTNLQINVQVLLYGVTAHLFHLFVLFCAICTNSKMNL